MEVVKISNSIVEVTESKLSVYGYDNLLRERQHLVLMREQYNAQADADIARIEALLAECDKLGVTTQDAVAIEQ